MKLFNFKIFTLMLSAFVLVIMTGCGSTGQETKHGFAPSSDNIIVKFLDQDKDYYLKKADPGSSHTKYEYTYDKTGNRITKQTTFVYQELSSSTSQVRVNIINSTYTYDYDQNTVMEKRINDYGAQEIIVYTYTDEGVILYYDGKTDNATFHSKYNYSNEEKLVNITTDYIEEYYVAHYTKTFSPTGDVLKETIKELYNGKQVRLKVIEYTYSSSHLIQANVNTSSIYGDSTRLHTYVYDDKHNVVKYTSNYENLYLGTKTEYEITYKNTYDSNNNLIQVSFNDHYIDVLMKYELET